MKILKIIGITLLSLGSILTIGTFLSTKYTYSQCGSSCGMVGFGEYVTMVYITFPMLLLGQLLYIIYCFKNRKIEPAPIRIIGSIIFTLLIIILFGGRGMFLVFWNIIANFDEYWFNFLFDIGIL